MDAADSLSTNAAAGLGSLANAWRPEVATASGIYLEGFVWFLVHAAVQFSRMVFVQPLDR